MLSQDITLDRLIAEIDQQLEILTAIAQDNAILVEQLRLLSETREMLLWQELENQRLTELIDPDDLNDHSAYIDRHADNI